MTTKTHTGWVTYSITSKGSKRIETVWHPLTADELAALELESDTNGLGEDVARRLMEQHESWALHAEWSNLTVVDAYAVPTEKMLLEKIEAVHRAIRYNRDLFDKLTDSLRCGGYTKEGS